MRWDISTILGPVLQKLAIKKMGRALLDLFLPKTNSTTFGNIWLFPQGYTHETYATQ